MRQFKRITQLIIGSILLCGVLSACNDDYLTRDNPVGTTDDKWWVNQSQLESVLSQLYLGIPEGVTTETKPQLGTMSGYNWSWGKLSWSGISDEGIWRANYSDYQMFTLGTANSSMRIVDEVFSKYTLIRRACRFLENYKNATIPVSLSPHEGIQEKDKLAAEARALRAYMHMELFMLFGPIPIVESSVTPAHQDLKPNTEDEIVEWVCAQFEMAAENLPKEQPTEALKHRFTKGACYACEAILYLYTKKYTEAAAAAKKCIDLEVYELWDDGTDQAYSHLFTYEGQRNNERILYCLGGMRAQNRRLTPQEMIPETGQAVISPTAAMVNAYELADGRCMADLTETEQNALKLDPLCMARDPRLRQTIWFPGETFLDCKPNPWAAGKIGTSFHTYTGYYVKKWVNSTDAKLGTYKGSLDFYVIRYAEILLTYAEALVASGDWQNKDVYDAIDAVRVRARMPKVDKTKYDTQAELLDLIHRERMVELAFEGVRLMDIRRLRIGEQVMNGMVYGAPVGYMFDDPATHNSTKLYAVEEHKFTSKDYRWPFPIAEINTNHALEQNPGW